MQEGEELAALYRIRFEAEFLPRKRAIWEVLCRSYFQRFIEHTATVVDVGCGYGEFINHIDAARKIGLDLNVDTRRYLAPDVVFHSVQAKEIASAIGEDAADVVFVSNFLEHLPDKRALDEFLGQVISVLRPGGSFMILGPNLRYLPGRYWDYYDHHLGLTHLSLREALELKGFEIKKCIDKFLPYTTQGALPTHPLLVRWYLYLPFIWRVLGKQFFLVATKPEQKRKASPAGG